MSDFENVTGFWKNKNGAGYYFKMTDEIRQKLLAVPNDWFVNLAQNEKKTDRHPDLSLYYKKPDRPNKQQQEGEIPF